MTRKALHAAMATLQDPAALNAMNSWHNTKARGMSGLWDCGFHLPRHLRRLEAALAEVAQRHRAAAAAALPVAAAYERARSAAAEARAAAESAAARAAASVALAMTGRACVAMAVGRAAARMRLQGLQAVMAEAGAAVATGARGLRSHPLAGFDAAEEEDQEDEAEQEGQAQQGPNHNDNDNDNGEEGPDAGSPAVLGGAPRGGRPSLPGATVAVPAAAEAEAGINGWDGNGDGGLPPPPRVVSVAAAVPEPRGRRFGWAARLAAHGVAALHGALAYSGRGGAQ
jgi:hypothetical protein